MPLSAQHIHTGFPHKTLLTDFSYTFRQGEFTAIAGRNGSGKTTLLHTLAGLTTPHKGTITLNEYPIQQLKYWERAKLLAITSTQRNLPPYWTVQQVISLGMYPHTGFLGTLSAAQQSKVSQVCQLCSIDDTLANQPLNALSDGEYQRVSLATAICQQTPFILLDEPTAHLDVVQRQATFELLKRLAHEQNIGIIICSHEIHLILRYTDTLILLGGDGTYIYGQSSELAHNPILHRIFPIF